MTFPSCPPFPAFCSPVRQSTYSPFIQSSDHPPISPSRQPSAFSSSLSYIYPSIYPFIHWHWCHSVLITCLLPTSGKKPECCLVFLKENTIELHLRPVLDPSPSTLVFIYPSSLHLTPAIFSLYPVDFDFPCSMLPLSPISIRWPAGCCQWFSIWTSWTAGKTLFYSEMFHWAQLGTGAK